MSSNNAEYTITRKRVFLFPCLKIVLDTARGGLDSIRAKL
jgi:hypothetical protein